MTGPDGEELFNELYADALSDCPSDFKIYCSDLEIDSLSEDSYECRILDLRNGKLAKPVACHYI